MQPLVKGALAVAVLAAASAFAPAAVRGRSAPPRPEASASSDLMKMPCGSREIPEGEACVPVPALTTSAGEAAEAAPGDVSPTDDAPPRLPRRPDRPAALRDFLLPLAGDPPLLPVPGADVDADDRSVVLFGAARGTPVHAVALEGQDGAFEVLSVERLPGRGLVVGVLAEIGGEQRGRPPTGAKPEKKTKKKKQEAEAFVVLFGSLDGGGPGIAKGGKLIDGAVVGFAGETVANGEPGLRFEVRRLRPGTDARATPLAKLVTDGESVATDARNVLPARVKEPKGGAAEKAP